MINRALCIGCGKEVGQECIIFGCRTCRARTLNVLFDKLDTRRHEKNIYVKYGKDPLKYTKELIYEK